MFRICGTPLLCLLLGGCLGQGQWGSGIDWPQRGQLATAARDAALAPETWVPVATAGLLIATDYDQKWTRNMAEDREMFGQDAEDVSSTLRDVATGAYLITALVAPSPTLADKSKGLMVGASTMVLDGIVSRGLKDLTKRERPNQRNDRSMPSGHASIAASRTTMAMRNLESINMPRWTRQMTAWSLRGVALGSGFARVEANKHYLSDVLVGYALGNFVANFMYNAFMEGDSDLPRISFQPVQGGGLMTFSVPIH